MARGEKQVGDEIARRKYIRYASILIVAFMYTCDSEVVPLVPGRTCPGGSFMLR